MLTRLKINLKITQHRTYRVLTWLSCTISRSRVELLNRLVLLLLICYSGLHVKYSDRHIIKTQCNRTEYCYVDDKILFEAIMVQEKKFSVVPEKKFHEIKSWFEEHFEKCDRRNYSKRSPFVVLHGPTGCGKTTTLERIASELKLSIKEYSETTDTSLYQLELKGVAVDCIDKRRSLLFENFVITNARYESLYADHKEDEDDAAAEFDDDDDFIAPILTRKSKSPPRGVIIHIESPLTLARSTPVFIQCLRRLKKIIKEISFQTPRRVAIVFEAVEDGDHVMSLPSRVKLSLGIQVFKLNQVTRANMKKVIELELKKYNFLNPSKDILEQLIDDCDGDVSACKNTLRLLCRQSHSSNVITKFTSTPLKLSKKQKTDHDRVGTLTIHPSLLRDISRGSNFFHILGKIFYQKRFYPESTNGFRTPRDIDRPFRTENTTENLVNQVESETKKLNAWLHQNYQKFCAPNDIEKAALFMDNLSLVDTMSLDSTQSTQYYENHRFIDMIQKHLAIESTVFSLYKDESKSKKSTEKRIRVDNGRLMILKSSVYTDSNMRVDNGHQGFAKPTGLMISKLSEDHQALLDRFSSKMTQIFGRPYEQKNLLLEYAPYMKMLLDKYPMPSGKSVLRYTLRPSIEAPLWAGNEHLQTIIEEIQKIDESHETDHEHRHETLMNLIDQCDSQKVKEEPGDVNMSTDPTDWSHDVLMYD